MSPAWCKQGLPKLISWMSAVTSVSTNCSRKSNTFLIQKAEQSRMTLELPDLLLYYVTFISPYHISVCRSVCVTLSYWSAELLLETMCTKQRDTRNCNSIISAFRGHSLLCPALKSVGKGPLLVPCDWGKPCYAMTLVMRALETRSRVDYCVCGHISNLNFHLSFLLQHYGNALW